MSVRLGPALQGRYTIEREIGAGGMATVYLARDVRHHRNVALKVLNPELGAVLGGERFLSEIEVTANLQHPNLLPLFDSGEAAGLLYYVMPYVEGESLRVRLEREKQLPVDEAIRIAKGIAGALDYAHRRGVVHRDLKPENILMQEGQPLIADFGIALAVSNAGGARITQTGLSLGTPQYMSPEQATADRVVDGRADIFSLATITYEMLAGDPPHTASTSQGIIARLLTEKPASVRTHRPNVPPHVDAALAHALEKLPADRFATAKEFAEALDARGPVTTSSSVYEATVAPSSRRARLREIISWALVAILGLWTAFRMVAPNKEPLVPPVVRSNFDLPSGAHINDIITGTTVALSPRGDMIAFTSTTSAGFQMYVRRFDELSAHQIAAAAGRNLAFSPDGRWIAFTEGNIIKKVSITGGDVVTISATTSGGVVPYGLAWGPRDTIYIGSFTGLYSAPANGGAATLVKSGGGPVQAGQSGMRWPTLLPDGETLVIATGNSSTFTASRLATYSLKTGVLQRSEIPLAMPLGLIDNHLVYVSPTGGLMIVPFDRAAGKPVGDPLQMDENVLVDPTAGVKASLSASGTLVYLRGRAQFQLVMTRGGNDSTVALIRDPGSYQAPRFSPDGQRVALTSFGANATDIWIYDLVRHTFARLTTEGLNLRPEWSPDGRDVIFISTRGDKPGIWRQPADGSGPARLLYIPEIEPFEALISPDNQWLIYRTAPGMKFSRDILAIRLADSTHTVVPIVTSPFTESQPRLSPDGKWLSYQSSESGKFEVYVRPFPGAGARFPVSENGGTEALWGASGHTLYYRNSTNGIVKVDVTMSPGFSIGARSVVLTGDYLTDASHQNYDISPDGRFLMLKRAGPEAQTVVVHNWARELREKVATK